MQEIGRVFKFPKGFLWGASTSSHQVEGNNINNWSLWEESEKRIKHLSSSGLIAKYGRKNYVSGSATDHYNLFKEDFDLAQSLNHNAHRFSIEWSRIEPKEGEFDEVEIKHYRNVILAFKRRGIEPMVTLYHWTHPLWFEEKGAWLNKDSSDKFARYTKKIAESYKDLGVKFWVTINEPLVFASNSYLKGIWPPQHKSLKDTYIVLNNLALAHKKTYKLLKKISSSYQIGIAKNNIYFEATPGLINKILKTGADWLWNFRFLNKIKRHQDFIGLNYYFHNRINGGFNKNANKVVTDMGWEIYPEGIYHVLMSLKKYKKPVYILENGLADEKDTKRTEFIKTHLYWISRAIDDGVDIRGYLYWSLLDNFEWDKGSWPRFGLIHVDYNTMRRTIRKSAKFYAKICKNNMLVS